MPQIKGKRPGKAFLRERNVVPDEEPHLSLAPEAHSWCICPGKFRIDPGVSGSFPGNEPIKLFLS